MPGAFIIIDQIQGGPVSPGTPAVSRDDLWLMGQVHLISGLVNASYDWQIIDAPPGSTATLDTPTQQTCHFTPDLIGTYLVQLITNGGGAGNVQVLTAITRFSAGGSLSNRGWWVPALGETTEDNISVRGWDRPIRLIFNDLIANASFRDQSYGALPGDFWVWTGASWGPGPGGGGGTLAGDVTGPVGTNIVSKIKGVRTPLLNSQFLGAYLQIEIAPGWILPDACFWDGSFLWVADRGAPSIFILDPTVSEGSPSFLTEIPITVPGISGVRCMTSDGTYVYTICDTGAAPPGTPDILIFDQGTGVLVGKAYSGTAGVCNAIVGDQSNLDDFYVQPADGTDVRGYNLLAVLAAFPALGVLDVTVPGTGNPTFTDGDLVYDAANDLLYSSTTDLGGQVFRIDPNTNLVTGTCPLAGAGAKGLVLGGGFLWNIGGSVNRIDTTLMAITGTVFIPGSCANPCAYDTVNDTIWVRQIFSSNVWVIDAIGLGPPTAATGAPAGYFAGLSPRGFAFQAGFFPRMWNTALNSPPGKQAALRYDTAFPYDFETLFIGPLGLKYVAPPTAYVVVSTVGPVFAVPTNHYSVVTVCADSTAGPITVTLPGVPLSGDAVTVKDRAGTSAVNNITVDGGAFFIDAALTYTIASNYASVSLVFNGTKWSVI